MKQYKKAVVFDLDGTLVNSIQDLANSVNFAMKQLNAPLHTVEEVRQMVGNGVAVLMKRALPSDMQNKVPEALALQRSFYSQHGFDNTKPYDGVENLLQYLHSQGILVVVHTNKDENVAKPLCQKLFGGLVDCVCGTVSDNQIKPSAKRLLQLLATKGNPVAVYCGDSDVDIATAKNAGIACVSVTWGFRTKEFLLQHGATHLADDVLQARQLLLSLLQV